MLAANPAHQFQTWFTDQGVRLTADAQFKRSVASAGDVNGDGYEDVIVIAYRYDNGQTDEGRAFVYLGSASGLSTIRPGLRKAIRLRHYLGSPML